MKNSTVVFIVSTPSRLSCLFCCHTCILDSRDDHINNPSFCSLFFSHRQYRISAVTKVGANELKFPNQETGRDEVVATYFGQKYFPLRVSRV